MSLYEILELGDPGLRDVAEEVAEVDDEVRTLIDDMFETMYDARGIGLAATQIGVLRRVVVIDLQDGGEEEALEAGPPPRQPRAFVNPTLVWESEELATYNEGCLSIPEQYAEVVRPARCRITFLDRDGKSQEEEMDGLMSTCIQHEIDHLNGVLFIDHLSRLKRAMMTKKHAKLYRAA